MMIIGNTRSLPHVTLLSRRQADRPMKRALCVSSPFVSNYHVQDRPNTVTVLRKLLAAETRATETRSGEMKDGETAIDMS